MHRLFEIHMHYLTKFFLYYRVFNVANVTISSANFGNYHDHSKYVVSANPDESYWVCIGDINRAVSLYPKL